MIKVLFVDDERIARIALNSMVEWENTEFQIVGAARDGLEALEAIKKYQPDIVVTDVNMPKMDGLTLARLLKEQNSPVKVIVLAGRDEFDYAKDADRCGVSDCLRKASFGGGELLSSLRRVAATFRTPGEERARRPVQWDSARIEAMLTRQVPPKLYEYGRNYRALYVYRSDIFVPIKRDALDSSKETLASLVSESVGDRPPLSVVPLTGEDCVLLYPSTSTTRQTAEEDGRRISSSSQVYMNVSTGCVLSENFSNDTKLLQCLQRCREASSLSLYFGFRRMIPQEKDLEYQQPLNKNDFSSIEMILTCILSSEYEKAERILHEILSAFPQNHVSISSSRKYLDMLFEAFSPLYCFYFDNGTERQKTLLHSYGRCLILKEFEELFHLSLQEIRESPLKADSTHYRREVRDMIGYIHRNIDTKITLTQLSLSVNMAGSYISRLFKSETGVNVTTYVNRLKMERAMVLLREPDTFIKQTAAALGYEDQSYFNRIFNKYTGMSPAEFRHSYQYGTYSHRASKLYS